MKANLKRYLRYFLQGLVLIAPVAVTIYVIYTLVVWFDHLWIDKVTDKRFPGLGAIITIIVITYIGYLSSSFVMKPLFASIEKLANRTPLVSILYSSVKDLFDAFVSDKKKFTKPVLVNVSRESNLKKLGFITETDLSKLGIKNMVAVYLPHSYNWSGNLFIVPPEAITPLEGVSSTDIMKFVVSGGITKIGTQEQEPVQKPG